MCKVHYPPKIHVKHIILKYIFLGKGHNLSSLLTQVLVPLDPKTQICVCTLCTKIFDSNYVQTSENSLEICTCDSIDNCVHLHQEVGNMYMFLCPIKIIIQVESIFVLLSLSGMSAPRSCNQSICAQSELILRLIIYFNQVFMI